MKKREENDAVLSTYFILFYRRGRERGERRDRETETEGEGGKWVGGRT